MGNKETLKLKVSAVARFALQLATPRTLVRYRGRFCTTHTTSETFTPHSLTLLLLFNSCN